MRALCLVVLALAACHSDSGLSPCSVTASASADTSESFIDCGSFSVGDPNYTDDAMASAQACVLNALTQTTSFLLIYDAADPSLKDDSHPYGTVTGNVSAGWVGTLVAGPHILAREYAGEGHAGDMSQQSVSVTTCGAIDATDACTPMVGVPCLTCTPLTVSSVICHE